MDEQQTALQPETPTEQPESNEWIEQAEQAAPAREKSLKEEFAEEEAKLTDEEKARLKQAKEELRAKWLMIGCFWGVVLGGLIGHYLLGTTWQTGIYTGLPLGLLAGLAGGEIFGALEKAMLLEHVGHYARPENESAAPQERH
jgi:F0F1-type ATP synthase assembly protein I